MTKKEDEEFFQSVVGKKIRLDFWSKCGSFIPISCDGEFMYGKTDDGRDSYFRIYNGFNKDLSGLKWEFVKDTQTSYPHKVTYSNMDTDNPSVTISAQKWYGDTDPEDLTERYLESNTIPPECEKEIDFEDLADNFGKWDLTDREIIEGLGRLK